MLELKRLTSIAALTKLQAKAKDLVSLRHYDRKPNEEKHQILICGGTGCHSSGCGAVKDALQASIDAHGLHDKVNIVVTGCHGFCEVGPLVICYPGGLFYVRVTPEDADEIIVSSSGSLCLAAEEIDGKKVGGKAPELLKALQDEVLREFNEETKA